MTFSTRSSRFAAFPAIVITAALCAGPAQMRAQQNQGANAQRQPVLVELFTSEGCSDCPPADALLGRLDQEQFVPAAQAIVLSEHVTYWNHLGWSDPFSFDAIDQRQQDYVREFSVKSPYTPELVVDGAAELLGGDAANLSRAVALAAATPKIALTIGDAHRAPDGSVVFTVRAATGAEGSLVATLAEDATRSEVARGENAGRTLHHVAVVRVLKEFGNHAADGRTLRLAGPHLLAAEKDGEPVRLVVFLIKRSNGHVVGAAEETLAH